MEIIKTADVENQLNHLMNILNGTQERRDSLEKFRNKKWIAIDDLIKCIDDIYKDLDMGKIIPIFIQRLKEKLSNSRPSGADNSSFIQDCFNEGCNWWMPNNTCSTECPIKNCKSILRSPK